MTHCVCTGECRGVSDDADAICQAEDCSMCSNSLVACECSDGQYMEAYKQNEN